MTFFAFTSKLLIFQLLPGRNDYRQNALPLDKYLQIFTCAGNTVINSSGKQTRTESASDEHCRRN